MLTPVPRANAEVAALAMQTTIGAATPSMHLYKSSFTPGPLNTLADFQANEVAFTGYSSASITGTWNLGLDDANQVILLASHSGVFLQSGVVATDVAGGYWVDDGATTPTMILATSPFDSPFQFNKTGNRLYCQASLQFPIASDGNVSTQVGP